MFEDLEKLLPSEMRQRLEESELRRQWRLEDNESLRGIDEGYIEADGRPTVVELIAAAAPRLGELPKRVTRAEAIDKYLKHNWEFSAETLSDYMGGKLGYGRR